VGAAPAQAPILPSGSPWDPDEEPRAVDPRAEDEEETGPALTPLLRRKPVRRRTSELAPRSGTLEVAEPSPEPERLPAVVVDDDELTGQRTFTRRASDDESDELGFEDERTTERRLPTEEPILLDRPIGRRASG